MPPSASEVLQVPARDGHSLTATVYRNSASSHHPHVVLIAGAMGVRRGFYDRFARHLGDNGFVAVTFDYRGIGDSFTPPLSRCRVNLRDWGELDVAGVIDWAEGRFPGARLSLVAHSVGGQIAGLADNIGRIEAILAVGVQSGYWRLWPFPRNWQVAALWYVLIPTLAPLLRFYPSKALGYGQDLPAGVALEWARWGKDGLYVHGRAGPPSAERFGLFQGRLLGLSFADDTFAPRRAVEAFLPRYPNADLELRHITPQSLGERSIGHFGFFRGQLARHFWDEAAEWLRRGRVERT